MVLPKDAQSCYPNVVQIFAYGAQSPSEDAEVHDEEAVDSDDYVGGMSLRSSSIFEYIGMKASVDSNDGGPAA